MFADQVVGNNDEIVQRQRPRVPARSSSVRGIEVTGTPWITTMSVGSSGERWPATPFRRGVAFPDLVRCSSPADPVPRAFVKVPGSLTAWMVAAE